MTTSLDQVIATFQETPFSKWGPLPMRCTSIEATLSSTSTAYVTAIALQTAQTNKKDYEILYGLGRTIYLISKNSKRDLGKSCVDPQYLESLKEDANQFINTLTTGWQEEETSFTHSFNSLEDVISLFNYYISLSNHQIEITPSENLLKLTGKKEEILHVIEAIKQASLGNQIIKDPYPYSSNKSKESPSLTPKKTLGLNSSDEKNSISYGPMFQEK